MLTDGPVDVIGFVYCPPGWDEQRLRAGPDADAIRTIAIDTYTDIAYIKEKNSIQITGESHDDVYKAQNQLNTLFFPVIVKSKRQWARPDRPGVWGQRRDLNGNPTNQTSENGNNNRYSNSQNNGIRKMKSEPALHNRHTFNGFSNNQNNNNGQSPFARTTSNFKPQQQQQLGQTPRQQWQPNNNRLSQQPGQQQPQAAATAGAPNQFFSQNSANGWR
ncbi:hypothetical protein BJ742DRAFT_776931 [Cladochytrium replicatum]|nr:hypothetical protein BJ742DRAFT_776931 [Cladochytrium replicatum]